MGNSKSKKAYNVSTGGGTNNEQQQQHQHGVVRQLDTDSLPSQGPEPTPIEGSPNSKAAPSEGPPSADLTPSEGPEPATGEGPPNKDPAPSEEPEPTPSEEPPSTDPALNEGPESTPIEDPPSTDPTPIEDPPSTDPTPIEGPPSTDATPIEGPPSTEPVASEDLPSTDPTPIEVAPSTEATPIEGPPSSDLNEVAPEPKTERHDSETEHECRVCHVDEMKDGEMREVEIGGQKALLVKDGGEFHALGAKCTHYGAPLVKGVVSNGHVRCPWHGACFNVKTGDIEDFPGLDSIQKFEVCVEDGHVNVKAGSKALQTTKRVKGMCCSGPEEDQTYLLIGGGASANSCAETLRQEGFKGHIVMATKEGCLPYDRPKLSKALTSKAEEIALRKADFYASYDIQVKCGKEAVSVDTGSNTVTFKDGETMQYNKLLLATGGSPRSLISLPGVDLENVCLLRTPDDANRIAARAKGKHVVVIGTSFIGMEAASFLADQGVASLTCLDILDIPFKLVLGDEVGLALKKLHEAKGTKFIAKNSPKEFVGENGKLKEVVLQDDTRLPADICIMGIGVFPTTGFLKDSGVTINERGFIPVDKHMKTNLDNVFASGDIVTFPLFLAEDQQANIQHWQMAHTHGRTAALNMLNQDVPIKSVPFFWTMQFGKSLRYTGYGMGFDDVIVKGSPEEFKFVAYYTKGDEVIAVASMAMDPIVAQAAEVMLCGKTITKQEVTGDDHECWQSKICS